MGLDSFEVLGWFALLAPAKTPANIVQLLNAELNKMVAKPQIVAKFPAQFQFTASKWS